MAGGSRRAVLLSTSPLRRWCCSHRAGCPSSRVAGAGCFGAALMLQPQLVADCCRAVAEAVDIPVSVKCRIGGCSDCTHMPQLWLPSWLGASCSALRHPSPECSMDPGVHVLVWCMRWWCRWCMHRPARKRHPALHPAPSQYLPSSVFPRQSAGVDDQDSYAQLCTFVRVVSEGSPVRHFVIHARKCLLRGLSPHQNRTIPPLRYEWAWALKRDFPHLQFSLNGGVQSLEEVACALAMQADGAASAAAATRPAAAGGEGGVAACSSGSSGSSSSGSGGNAAASSKGSAEGGSADGDAAVSAAAGAPAESAAAETLAAAAPSRAAAGAAAAAGGGPEVTLGGVLLGVMVGRAAYHQPWDMLAGADTALFGAPAPAAASRRQVLEAYARYADGMLGRWRSDEDGRRVPGLRVLFKPLLGMFHNEPRARMWRAAVSSGGGRGWVNTGGGRGWTRVAGHYHVAVICAPCFHPANNCCPLLLLLPPPAAGGWRSEGRHQREPGAGADAPGADGGHP